MQVEASVRSCIGACADPDRVAEVLAASGLSTPEQLAALGARSPSAFADIVADFLDYIKGAQLVIHNAAFDIGFINHELSLAGKQWGRAEDHCTVLDTLAMARKLHPGQRNTLDALCKRYEIDNSHRELHGALLDAEILADVYLGMTGGQTSLILSAGESDGDDEVSGSLKLE